MMLGRKHGWGPFLFCFTGIQEYFVSLSPTDLRGSGLQDHMLDCAELAPEKTAPRSDLMRGELIFAISSFLLISQGKANLEKHRASGGQ